MLRSKDIAEEKRNRLKQIFPEVFTENKIDFDQLKAVLGEVIETNSERYGLNWAGKSECMKIIQESSVATLKPDRSESVDFDNTGNVYIEGENLEVLKLLQKSYFGKIKMIYIDPPYNTGKDFVYKDKFGQSLDDYLKLTGQVDAEGRKLSTNSETDGRYHSNWLNMMYPRLYLARNLLRDDGVIFISIDDHEVANLRAVCDRVFGEENLVIQFVWEKKTPPNNVVVGNIHEYILLYAKNKQSRDFALTLMPRTEQSDKGYKNPDNDHRGVWKAGDLSAPAKGGRSTPSLVYDLINPITGRIHKPPEGRMWIVPIDEMKKKIKEGTVYWGKSGDGRPKNKRFLDHTKAGVVIPSILKNVAMNTNATKDLQQLFENRLIFETPKPVSLIKHFLTMSVNANENILDFFSGSSTTADAVMQLNAEDQGNRKYIMVQLPELTPEHSPARQTGYTTIADIGKERIRRAARKIKEAHPDKLNLDLGFKVFKLDKSNFNIWDPSPNNDLQLQLELHTNPINPESTDEDIVFELLLKMGMELTVPIQKIAINDKSVLSINDNKILICLEKEVTEELVERIADLTPKKAIFLDSGFKGNDQLKINAAEIFKILAQNQQSESVFMTV